MKGYLFSSLCVRTHGAPEKRYPFILKNRGTIIRGKTLAKRGGERLSIYLKSHRVNKQETSACR